MKEARQKKVYTVLFHLYKIIVNSDAFMRRASLGTGIRGGEIFKTRDYKGVWVNF